ncbi:MAG: glycoside hydrolase [Rikenellaceae bacterium]|nr:glycoside hydrolase [Rikenellaceae bacterium]
MQKKLIFLFSFIFLFQIAYGQSSIDGKIYNGVRLRDLAGKCDSYIVAQDSMAQMLYPSVANASDVIYTAYIKRDTTKWIEFVRSNDEGRTWNRFSTENSFASDDITSVSLYDISTKNRRRNAGRDELLLFVGGSPLKYSAAEPGTKFAEPIPVSSFGAYRITSMTKLNNGKLMALFHDDGRFIRTDLDTMHIRRSVIYKIYSSDGGKNWSLPDIALRHNQHGLYDAVVFDSPNNKDRELIMICSDRVSGTAYISFSTDNGEKWTYPVALPDFIQGDRFSVAVINKKIYIAYRDMCRHFRNGSVNPFFGDLVMWTGDLKELVKGRKNGLKVRIADNYPQTTEPDMTDLRVYDCGFPTVTSLSKNTLSVVAYGRWDTNRMPYIKNFIIPMDLFK